MAELAAATSDTVMVDPWEAAQPGWQRTLAVMRRLSVVCGALCRNSLAIGVIRGVLYRGVIAIRLAV